jgi:2-oxoglutarate ferredoxin oxidoreductase subunit alpha
MHNLTIEAFTLADRFRSPVMVLTDGRLGQMMEPLKLYEGKPPASPPKPWALTGAAGRQSNMIRTLLLDDGVLEQHNLRLQRKFNLIKKSVLQFEELNTRDCEVLIVAYGTSARIAKGVMDKARSKGMNVGLLRPITLWPFPSARIRQLASQVEGILVVEMRSGQMVEDVRLAAGDRTPVVFEGRMGGAVPEEKDVLAALRGLLRRGRGRKRL